MHSDIPPYMYIIFTAATAIGVLIQAGILLGMFLGLAKVWPKVERILDVVNEHALPLVATSKHTFEEIAPRIKVISANLAEITETVKQESKTIKGSVDDVLERTRAQTARVDEMVSGTLDGISHAGSALQHGISVPIRQLNGILNGFRAGFDVLLRRDGGRTAQRRPIDPRFVEDPVVVEVEEELAGRPGL